MEDNLVSKPEANYKVAPEGEPMCASCAQFISPKGCKLVSGTIAENGTCDLYSGQSVEDTLFGGSNG